MTDSPLTHRPVNGSGLLRLDLAVGLIGLALASVSVLGLANAPGALAAAPASDGSDRGSQGLLTSDSPVTSRWDNNGNPDTSVVPRNQTQVIAHTGGKNYFDIDSSVLDAYDAHFGDDDGKGGLKVSVSQTSDVVNQAVTVDISGADPDLPAGGADSRTYFQVFQCWGAMGADGHPDPNAANPDPASCQVGATGSDAIGGSAKREYRVVGGDPLVKDGDWEKYDDTSSIVEVPFLSITGEESGPNLSLQNSFFNKTTTNELSHVVLPDSGATTRQVELQTGSESEGLGCGSRPDAVSTSTCWLVVVPRIQGVLENLGPTSPSVWAQRIQVQLGFRDVVTSCGKGTARSLLAGSEMLSDAAASWIPGVCDSAHVALGYTRLGDEVARNQFTSGSNNAILTSLPINGSTAATYVPLSVTAPVFAYNVDYQPACIDEDTPPSSIRTDAGAKACGYKDLADLQADLARAGQPIRDLKLDATLVAKLLTQSYQNGMMNCAPDCTYAVNHGIMPAWSLERPTSLTDDPEFRSLNPQLHVKHDTAISEPILEALRSDAAATVWRWLLADPASAAFLSGCPDANGVTINPFYSSRSYAGCPGKATELGDQAKSDRAATKTPTGFVDQPITYPPDGSPFPLPGWQEQPAQGTTPARTLVDQFPRVDVMQLGARDAFTGYKPRNSEFCRYDLDPSCFPAPGKWKDPKTPQRFGQRQIFALAGSAVAARYQLPTAALCDDTGAHCVAADTKTLQSAANGFIATSAGGVVGPGPLDYAGGDYPLTLPVYAAVRSSLSSDARAGYADAFAFVVKDGQVPGYLQGNLPPGYAPLTTNLQQLAGTAIDALRATTPPSASASSSPKPSSSHSASPSTSTSPSTAPTAAPTQNGGGGGIPPPGGGSSPQPSASASPSPSASAPVTTVQTAPVSASTESWPGWMLPLGVGIMLAAGALGPFLRRRTSLRLR